MSDGVTVDASAPLTFGGDVNTVLQSPRTVMPPKTLEEARNQPGRREQIEGIVKQIESQGIKYVFFQQISVTGRVMGKGVVASFLAAMDDQQERPGARDPQQDRAGSSRAEDRVHVDNRRG